MRPRITQSSSIPRWLVVAIGLSACATLARAQDALLLTHMRAVPKRLLVNPAAEVPYRAWLSLPVVGHVDQTVNLPFSARDVLDLKGVSLFDQARKRTWQEWDQVGLKMQGAIDGLEGVGQARITTRANLLAGGVRTARGLVHVSLDQQVDIYAASGPQVLAFIYYGVPYVAAGNLSVEGLAYDGHTRSTLAVGYQRRSRRERWRFGGNLKVVKMQAHVRLETIDAVPRIDSAGVAAHYEGINRVGGLADLYEEQPPLTAEGLLRRGFAGGNYGLGVDLGVTYRAGERVTYSASVVDLGVAWLNYQTRAYAFRNSVYMDGRVALAESNNVDLQAASSEISSLTAEQETTAINGDPYAQALPATLYLAADYRLTEQTRLGAVVRNSFRGDRLQTAVALSVNARAWRYLDASASVAWTDGAGVGVGLGASLTFPAVQVYLGSDNALAFASLERARWANAFAGVTLLLPERKVDRGLVKRRRNERKCYRF